MPDFKKNFRSGNARPSFSRGGQGFAPRGRSFEKKELFDAECNKCHKATQVPFRPNGKKPVYCRDCFTPDTGSERQRTPRFERRPAFRSADTAPVRIEKDSRIDDVLHRLDAIERTLEKLTAMLEDASRKEALTSEVRKHMAPVKAATKKKAVAKKAAA